MDITPETIENFETLLKNQNPGKPIALYSGSKHEDSDRIQLKPTYTSRDILLNVSRQLKALQSADCVKNDRCVPRNMYKYKKSSFVPVNMLTRDEEVPHQSTNINKFETQCISDTQLLNIVQDAEALDTHDGVTQEFQTAFEHTNKENENSISSKDIHVGRIDIDCTDDEETLESNGNNYIEANKQIEPEFPIIDISLKDFDSDRKRNTENTPIIDHETNENEDIIEDYMAFNETLTVNYAQMHVESIKVTESIDKQDIVENMDRPSSPVFGIRPVNKKPVSSSLVFDLVAFENFEKLAAPIIEETSDIETAKHLINSQIIGKELCLLTNTEAILNENGKEISFLPIIDNDLVKIEESIEIFTPKSQEEQVDRKSTASCQINNDKFILKDEILFSSDEEEEYIHKNAQDLPFTCVLETSFYEQSDVLDKTMYVGFQTASNKSIQICTDSFFRAKSLFDSMGASESEPTLTELVKKCDAKENSKANIINDHDCKEIDSIRSEENGNVSSFVGLKTANEPFIDVSIDALIKSKALFQDIDNDLPNDADGSLTHFSSIISKTSFETFNNNKNKKQLLDTTTAEPKNLFQRAISLMELNICNENAIENIKNKITENIAKGFYNSGKLDNYTEDYEYEVTKSNIDDDILKEFEGVEMSQESINGNKYDSKEKVTGFKTASNKDIIVSDAAVAKTKNIFQDIDLVEVSSKIEIKGSVNTAEFLLDRLTSSISDDKYPIRSDMGFKTASNKKINISKHSLAKTRNIFHDIDSITFKDAGATITDLQINAIDTMSSEAKGSILDDSLNGQLMSRAFKTTNNKEIKISNEALLKSKNIFQGIEKLNYVEPAESPEPPFQEFKTASDKVDVSDDSMNWNEEIFDDNHKQVLEDLPQNISDFVAFHTASNKKVTVSESLEKSKKLFEDMEIVKPFDRNMVDFCNSDTVFKGFQTASMKPVKVSAQALVLSKKILQDIDKEIFTDENTASHDTVSKFESFQTASNKAVKISDEVLAETRKISQDLDQEISSNDLVLNMIDNSKLQGFQIDKMKVCVGFEGFQTASNKQVKISEEALEKSRKIFEDIDNVHDNKGTSSSFKGFQTASNKEVRISEEALAKSRKMFEETNNIHYDKDKYTGFKGFQTASNKQVNISEEALTKSRKMFEKIDNVYDIKEITRFHTASNKEVRISEEALAKSKRMFEETDNNHDDKDKSTGFKGFQTARNKQVNISEQALARSKQLFQDVDLGIKNATHDTKSVDSCTNIFSNASKIDDIHSETANATYAGFKTANKSNNEDSKEAKLEAIVAPKDSVNIENIINTQVLNNFEQTLYTEDFCKETPKKSKRSGSPILSCPKAKKRKKFEIPYSQYQINDLKHNVASDEIQNSIIKPDNIFVFDNNYKKFKRYTIKDLEALEKESNRLETHYIDPYILDFEFENLLNFKFRGKRNEITDKIWTIEDLKKCFQDSVNKKFIPEGWMDNHLKLILWKLLSYEIKFSNTMSFVCTARNVIEQLKYRYDKELYNSERPALRKIMEKDDTSSRTIVLCVVAIFENGVKTSSIANLNNIELLLTDGWYCIKASIDKMLAKLIADGKIVVGSKIVTNGAELVNCEQGVAPWEDTSSIRLKLSGNSTRRARWDARLGYHGNAAILCPLSAVRAEGGRVSKLRVVVTRVYPALYVERFEDGSTVTRSERLEHLHQMGYETERQAVLEKIYEEVEKEFSDQDSQDSDSVVQSGAKRQCLDSGSQIAKVMKTSRDPLQFRSHLTDTQKSLLQEHTTRKREKLLEDIQKRVLEKMDNEGLNVRRNVIRLLKVRVAGVEERGGTVEVTRAMMSVWKPSDAVLEMISEGSWMEVVNVVPTAVRYSEIQISAGRQSIFSQSKHRETEKLKPYTDSLKRTCHPIKDLAKNPSMTTDYNEIDTVGLIFVIDPSVKDFDPKRNQFQNVYLADEEKNIICANFWGGLKKFGFENVLDTGQIVVCTNLQKRAGNTRKNIPQYRVTEFSYFTKTPKNEHAQKIFENITVKLSCVDKRRFCEDCICLKNNYTAVKLQGNAENITPYRFQNIDINSTRNRIYIDSPLPHKKLDDNLNLTGLDFESTFKQTDTQDLSPKALLRKKQVNDKIAKLKMYGEPPPLSPIQISNRSKNAAKAYKSPLASKPDDPSVASEKKNLLNENEKTTNIASSPIIMNRTFVKRSNVNPVKLNFENVSIDENTACGVKDHFAEDFDASPPLSLD